jgi:hypothetical protein
LDLYCQLNAGELEILRQAVATADEIVLVELSFGRRRWWWLSMRAAAAESVVEDHPGSTFVVASVVDSLALPDEGEESGLRPGRGTPVRLLMALEEPCA